MKIGDLVRRVDIEGGHWLRSTLGVVVGEYKTPRPTPIDKTYWTVYWTEPAEYFAMPADKLELVSENR